MVTPNSTPEHTHYNPTNDHGGTSSIEEPDLRHATLSRQSSQGSGALTKANLDNIVEMVRNMPRTCSNLSMNSSDSNSTVGKDASDDVAFDDSKLIDPEMYMALVNGNRDDVLKPGVNLCELRCKKGRNSALHIAVRAGQDRLISDILIMCKDIIKSKNSDGDLAFHCAAKSAQLGALKALTESGISSAVLREKNNEENTALHIALENNQKEMAEFLVDECPEACYEWNEKRVSPLYMAIKLKYWGLVNKMIDYTQQLKPGSDDALMSSNSVLHAAIESESIDILKEILEHHGKLIESLDEDGQTPLSYAAFKGFLPGVQYLLKKFPHFAYKCNEDGSFPIHKAASGGHVQVIKEFHTSRQLLNGKGQNILHIAAKNGKAKVVSYILKRPELERLINLKDEDGNTPLHLAAKGFHPRVVYILTRESKTNHGFNKDGLTALDLAEIHAESPSSFDVRLTWMALRYVDAPRSSQSTRRTYLLEYLFKLDPDKKNKEENGDKTELENFNNRINTFLLVATLVATVTFAAGFTAPGGYKQDEPNIGMAVLADKWAFQIFMICNTAALYSSILSVVSLIWAHAGDLKLILVSLKFALPLLGFALSMMSLAFMMGIFVVLKTLHWLSYVVLGMGSVFLPAVLLVFIPLYNPSNIRNPVVRFFFSGPLLLLLFVCEKSITKYA